VTVPSWTPLSRWSFLPHLFQTAHAALDGLCLLAPAGPAADAAGAVAGGFVAAVRRRGARRAAPDGADGIAGLRAHHRGAVPQRGPGRGAGGHGHGQRGNAVRFPGSPRVRVGAAAAAGHAGLRGGLRLHRFPAVQRAAAGGFARDFRPAGPGVPGNPQHAGCDLGVHLLALSLCVPAGTYRALRTCIAADGGRAPAGRAAVAPHPRGGAAAGAPG